MSEAAHQFAADVTAAAAAMRRARETHHEVVREALPDALKTLLIEMAEKINAMTLDQAAMKHEVQIVKEALARLAREAAA